MDSLHSKSRELALKFVSYLLQHFDLSEHEQLRTEITEELLSSMDDFSSYASSVLQKEVSTLQNKITNQQQLIEKYVSEIQKLKTKNNKKNNNKKKLTNKNTNTDKLNEAWTCSKCTYKSNFENKECKICGTMRKSEPIYVSDNESSFSSSDDEFQIPDPQMYIHQTKSTTNSPQKKLESAKNMNNSDSDDEICDPTQSITPKKEKISKPKSSKKKYFKCTYNDCGVVCKSKNGFEGHKFQHLPYEARPFPCKKNCGSRFIAHNKLVVHEAKCNGTSIKRIRKKLPKTQITTPLLRCKFNNCQKSFRRQVDLDKHTKLHEVKPYICDYKNCQKQFSSERCFKSHQKTHDN